MARTLRILSAVCTLSFVLNLGAESRSLDTYNSIVDRNPFGLKDPPVVQPPQTNAPPAVKKEDFYLTGISTIGNPKKPKAYLLAKDASKKDYEQKYYNLGIGDRQGDVSLQEVDAKGRRVKILYLGEEKWLSMKENGVPAPTGPAPGMQGVPGMQGHGNIGGAPGAVGPGGMPAPIPLPLPNGGGVSPQQAAPVLYPNAGNVRRNVRSSGVNMTGGINGAPTSYQYPGGTAAGNLASANAIAANPNVVNFGNQNGNPNSPQPQQAPQPEVDIAQQLLNMHANHLYQTQRGEITPPIPPLP